MKLKDKRAFPNAGGSNGFEPTMQGFRSYSPTPGMTLKEYTYIQLVSGLIKPEYEYGDVEDALNIARITVEQMFGE